MLNLPKMPNCAYPFIVSAYVDGEPWTGAVPSVPASQSTKFIDAWIVSLDTAATWNTTTGTFTNTGNEPPLAITDIRSQDYIVHFPVGNLPRGHYRLKARAYAQDGSIDQEYAQDFSVGLYTGLNIDYSATYDGKVLTLSVWIEESGTLCNDFSLMDLILREGSGAVVPGVTFPRATPVNGVFRFCVPAALPSGSYMLDVLAAAPGLTIDGGSEPIGVYPFMFRAGLARP